MPTSRLACPQELQAVLDGRPLPRPLTDPLMVARRYFWLLALLVAGAFVAASFSEFARTPLGAWTLAGSAALAAAVQLCLFLVLPRRPVHVLYLRAFRGDEDFNVRAVVDGCFHPEARLGGLRPPRRKIGLALRPALMGYFIMRYAGSRYSNLEAGKDWMARLWRSFADVRGAVIDVRQMTDLLAAETRLAFSCLGANRLLFIVDESRGAQEWEAWIRENVGQRTGAQRLSLACWRNGTQAALDAFIREIVEFKKGLPAEPAGPAWHALHDVKSQIAGRKDVLLERASSYVLLALGAAMAIAVAGISPDTSANIFAAIASNPFAAALSFALAWYFILVAGYAALSLFRSDPVARYLRGRSRVLALRGSEPRHAVLAVASVVLGLGQYGGVQMMRSAAENARITAARADLHAISTALQLFRVSTGRWPDEERWIENIAKEGLLRRTPTDPWGESYIYQGPRTPDGEPSVHSKGPDRVSGTADDITSSR